MVRKFPLLRSMGNAIYCGLCISQSADKAGSGPKLSQGKEGVVIDRVKSH